MKKIEKYHFKYGGKNEKLLLLLFRKRYVLYYLSDLKLTQFSFWIKSSVTEIKIHSFFQCTRPPIQI